ncbi:hypothetical protein, partial [Shewanella scandinavica]|uniref:hypothetical protein n=1 Tax=Shewanella scandinavica TaxID=3063538 RepID=UPI0031994BA2
RADGSVGSPHVRVGHRQAPNYLIEMQRSQLNKLAFLCLKCARFSIFERVLLVEITLSCEVGMVYWALFNELKFYSVLIL